MCRTHLFLQRSWRLKQSQGRIAATFSPYISKSALEWDHSYIQLEFPHQSTVCRPGFAAFALFAQGQFESGWQNWGRKGKGLEKGVAPINSLWSCSCFCLFPVFVVSDAEYGEHIAHVMWSDVKQIEIWEICCLQCAVTSRAFGWFQFCSPKLAKLYGGIITRFYVHIYIYIHNTCLQHIWLYHLTPYMDVVYIHIYIYIYLLYIYTCVYILACSWKLNDVGPGSCCLGIVPLSSLDARWLILFLFRGKWFDLPIRNPEFHWVSWRYSRAQTDIVFFFPRRNCDLVTSKSFQEREDRPNCRFPCVKGTKERQVASIDSCFTEKRGAGRGETFAHRSRCVAYVSLVVLVLYVLDLIVAWIISNMDF